MAYRSEAGKIGNKPNYQDLNMSHYPGALDSRQNNVNMKGFTNVGEEDIPDYIMAEYVNSISDAVMAVERALGTNPMVPISATEEERTSLIENSNVSKRIGAIEGGLLDERYGGSGWTYNPNRPTLKSHNHDGLNGHPGKIHLQNEVEGVLLKGSMDLTQATGVTGADLAVSKTNSKKIDEALLEMLSKKDGGTIQGPVKLAGGLRSRTTIECTAPEMNPSGSASLNAAQDATRKQDITAGGNLAGTIHEETLGRDLMFGRYVIGVRAKSTTTTVGDVFRIRYGSQIATFSGSDFVAPNTHKMFYLVFDHASENDILQIQKLATTGVATISVDNFFVQPVHPAVFDR